MAASHDWYTIVKFGSDPAPPRGPFHGIEALNAARARWAESEGCLAGTYEASGSVRAVGPYCTRQDALDADISDYGHFCKH